MELVEAPRREETFWASTCWLRIAQQTSFPDCAQTALQPATLYVGPPQGYLGRFFWSLTRRLDPLYKILSV